MEKEDRTNLIKDLLIIGFIAIVCVSSIFCKTYNNLDEYWNFSFAKNIVDGLLPYKDFNMIVTPLLPFICSVFLKIFGVEFLTMRIVGVIFLTSIFNLAYLILKKLTNKDVALLGLVIILFSLKNVLCIDYNYAVLLMGLIVTYIEISRKEELMIYNFKYDFIIGIIAGIAILFKHTTGLVLAMACVGYKIFGLRKKEDFKVFLKIFFTRLCGVLVNVIVLIIYLLITKSMSDFINYVILGISEFTNKKLYIELIKDKQYYSILAIMLPLTILLLFINMFKKDTKKDVYILFAYSIACSIVVYPISDESHLGIAVVLAIISLIYLIYEIVSNIHCEKINKKIKYAIYGLFSFVLMFCTLSMTLLSMTSFYYDYIKVDKEKELSHLYGVPELEGLKERINFIDAYILKEKSENKTVYILDAEAVIYFMPLDMYNKDYDQCLIGNLGKDGEERIIKEIGRSQDIVYLIQRDCVNWQNSEKIRKYIIENLEKTGEISIFDIYEQKGEI